MFTGYTDKLDVNHSYIDHHHKEQTVDLNTDKLKKFWKTHYAKGLMFITSLSSVSDVDDDDKIMVSGGDHPKYIVRMTGISKTTATLQKQEMAIMKTPSMFNADGEEATLVQGPSLIGVHANKTEDEDVVKFSK